MTVNNEIGVIQPMEEIGKLCRSRKVFFHTDGAQAVGKIPIDVNKWNVDLMSISAHKIYGPKGMGACYVRRRPRVRIDPIISGGGQERGLRSGTLAPPLVVGFGEACRIAYEELEVSLWIFYFFSSEFYDEILHMHDRKSLSILAQRSASKTLCQGCCDDFAGALRRNCCNVHAI
jgi:cysteine desulfurase